MAADNPQSRAPTGTRQPTRALASQCDELDKLRRQTLHALVGEQVLFALGKPQDLLKVQVRSLWDGRFRVNVFVGEDVPHARILHSYFIEADDDGNVLSTAPQVHKHY